MSDFPMPRSTPRTYGRKALASASRRVSINSTPTPAVDSSDSSSSDDEVRIQALLLSVRKGKGRAVEVLREEEEKEDKVIIVSRKASPSRSRGTSSTTKPVSGSYLKSIVGGRKTGIPGSAIGSGGGTEWDEEAAFEARGSRKELVPKRANGKKIVEKVSSVLSRRTTPENPPSATPSPTKRSRTSTPKALAQIVPSAAPVSSSRYFETEEVSPPRRKRPKVASTSTPRTLSKNTPVFTSSPGRRPFISNSSTPRKQSSLQESSPTTPQPRRTYAKQPNPLSKVNHSELDPVASTSTISVPIPVSSPARDLASVFDRYNASDSVRNSDLNSPRKGLSRTGSGLVASMGSRSPSKVGKDSTSRSFSPLNRSNSFPNFPLSPSIGQPLAPSSSLPLASEIPPNRLPGKPIVRSNTSLGIAQGDSMAAAARGGGGTKRTYGGARSFKRDLNEESLYTTDTDVLPSSSKSANTLSKTTSLPYKERESYESLRNKWGVDEEEELNAMMGGPEGNDLKSVTQLREKGENTRFADNFAYLLEGLAEEMSLQVKRSSALEILGKLLEVDFLRKLMASGFVERVYTEFHKGGGAQGDRVLDPALAFLVATMVKDQRIGEPLVRLESGNPKAGAAPSSEVLTSLAAILSKSWAGEEIGGSGTVPKGVSKADARSLTSLRAIMDKSSLPSEASLPSSSRSLSLLAIASIASYRPRFVFLPQQLICDSGAFEAVIASFLHECRDLELRLDKYRSGFDLIPSNGSISLALIDTTLRIFESCSATSLSPHLLLSSHIDSISSSLSTLVLVSHILSTDPSTLSATASGAMDCLSSSLKLLVDLTTKNSEWSHALGRTELVGVLIKIIVACRTKIVGKGFEKRSLETSEEGKTVGETEKSKEENVVLRFDLLCLALGVLTNMVETVESTKEVLRKTLINPSCVERRKCGRVCGCQGKKSAILRLTDLYLDPLDDSLNELNTSFIHGYSGILLGLIMLDTPLNQSIILSALSDHPIALKDLLLAMEEFATLHDQSEVAKKMVIEEEEIDIEMEETQREEEGDVDTQEGAVDSLVSSRIRRMLLVIRG